MCLVKHSLYIIIRYTCIELIGTHISEEEKAELGVVTLLRQFALHPLDGSTEEESDEKLIGTLATNHAQGINVGGPFLDVYDE